MKVLIVPNPFKNALSAEAAGHAMKEGILAYDPHAEVEMIPMADGGDGSLKLLIEPFGADLMSSAVLDPLGRKIHAQWGFNLETRTAIIELAEASGIRLLKSNELDPFKAHTFGTGELINEALAKGAQTIYLTVGGSATLDGGFGILKALGTDFLDKSGHALAVHQLADLRLVDALNFDRLRRNLHQVNIEVLVDVENKLCGNEGAVRIYGPQKGVQPHQIQVFENIIQHWGNLLTAASNQNIFELVGGGASGGVPSAMAACHTQVTLHPGASFLMDLIKIPEKLLDVDVVLTCEGKIDSQTSHGKGPGVIAKLAHDRKVACIGLCGQLGDDYDPKISFFYAVFPINKKLLSPELAMEQTASNLRYLAGQIYALMLLKPPEVGDEGIT
jgi:glycerate 2-kinase